MADTAIEDISAAKAFAEQLHGYPRQASYHAQQAAEKALKALLSAEGVAFHKTHDLIELLALVPAGHDVSMLMVDWAGLSDWAIRGRYPGTGLPAREQDARIAVAVATQVVNAVSADLANG